jgi:hypothetical protein
MATQTYNITFEGYWREKNIGGIANKSGIYCVYTCVYNQNDKTISIKKLIYIGESEAVNDRIQNHEKLSEWKRYLQAGQELCFNFGEVPLISRNRCEAAMINHHRPIINTEYRDNFPYDTTTLNISGKNKFLNSNFTVYRN